MNYNHNTKKLTIATHRGDMRTYIRVNFLRKTKTIIIFELKKTTIMRETVRSYENNSLVFLDLKRAQFRLNLTATQNLLFLFLSSSSCL